MKQDKSDAERKRSTLLSCFIFRFIDWLYGSRVYKRLSLMV